MLLKWHSLLSRSSVEQLEPHISCRLFLGSTRVNFHDSVAGASPAHAHTRAFGQLLLQLAKLAHAKMGAFQQLPMTPGSEQRNNLTPQVALFKFTDKESEPWYAIGVLPSNSAPRTSGACLAASWRTSAHPGGLLQVLQRAVLMWLSQQNLGIRQLRKGSS